MRRDPLTIFTRGSTFSRIPVSRPRCMAGRPSIDQALLNAQYLHATRQPGFFIPLRRNESKEERKRVQYRSIDSSLIPLSNFSCRFSNTWFNVLRKSCDHNNTRQWNRTPTHSVHGGFPDLELVQRHAVAARRADLVHVDDDDGARGGDGLHGMLGNESVELGRFALEDAACKYRSTFEQFPHIPSAERSNHVISNQIPSLLRSICLRCLLTHHTPTTAQCAASPESH